MDFKNYASCKWSFIYSIANFIENGLKADKNFNVIIDT